MSSKRAHIEAVLSFKYLKAVEEWVSRGSRGSIPQPVQVKDVPAQKLRNGMVILDLTPNNELRHHRVTLVEDRRGVTIVYVEPNLLSRGGSGHVRHGWVYDSVYPVTIVTK